MLWSARWAYLPITSTSSSWRTLPRAPASRSATNRSTSDGGHCANSPRTPTSGSGSWPGPRSPREPPNGVRSDVGRVADSAVGDVHARPYPRAAEKFASGTDIGAVADPAVADQRPGSDPGAEADDGALDHRSGLDAGAVEDHRPVQPHTRS